MELKQLLTNFTEYPTEIHGTYHGSADLLTVRHYTANQHVFQPSVLYIADTKLLPPPDLKHAFVCLCHGKHVDFHKYDNSSFTLLYVGDTLDSNTLVNLSLEYLTEVQQITSGMHIMVNALFSGKGLQYLIDTAAQIFGNPLYVVDLQGKYLAISTSVASDNEFYCSQNKIGYISEEGLIYIRQNRIDEKVRSLEKAYYFFNDLAHAGTLIDGIYIQGIEIGHIMLQETERPFSEFDSVLFHRFAQLTALELQRNSFYTSNKGVMYSYFLADLIKDSTSNVASINARLATLGFRLKENLYIMLIPSFSYHESDLRTDLITQSLQQIFPESLYMIYEGNIVFLITKSTNQGFSEAELTKLNHFLSANGLTAGISNFYENLRDTSRFYQQAVTSATLGTHLNRPGPAFYYEDLYLYQMLDIFAKTDNELVFLIQPGLKHLLSYDQNKDGELIHTLQEYLKFPGQPARVAESLHIHKNTLLYRMGKIKEITHCEFNVGEDFLSYGLSFKILEYLHMI